MDPQNLKVTIIGLGHYKTMMTTLMRIPQANLRVGIALLETIHWKLLDRSSSTRPIGQTDKCPFGPAFGIPRSWINRESGTWNCALGVSEIT